jgi:hypothetical protein
LKLVVQSASDPIATASRSGSPVTFAPATAFVDGSTAVSVPS